MDSFKDIVARGLGDDTNSGTVNLLIAILSLVFFGLLLVALLTMLRRIRRRQQMRAETLPQYYDVQQSANIHHLTIETKGIDKMGRSSVIVISKEGQPMLANPRSPPHSPDNAPEIHITFPDEHDEHGRKQNGRVLVVRVGETSVGLEPLDEEQLPAYEKESNAQFYSIDMDQIGGLKEKDPRHFA